jgi:hypothetical protein
VKLNLEEKPLLTSVPGIDGFRALVFVTLLRAQQPSFKYQKSKQESTMTGRIPGCF